MINRSRGDVAPDPGPRSREYHQRIQPSSRWRALHVGELWRYRGLLGAMTKRDLTLRYRQTMLGPLWVVLQPLLGAGIFSFVFGSVARFKSDGVPYFLFSYAGLLAWNPFSNTLLSLSTCLVTNMNLVSKIYFPRLILPIAQMGSKLLDFGVSFILFLVLSQLYGLPLTARLLTIPLWVVLAFSLALGPGLFIAALNVSYRDVGLMVPIVVPLFLYLCPIAYPASEVSPHLQMIFRVNPLVGLVNGFRWAVLGKGSLDWGTTTYSASVALTLVVGGLFFFRSHERRFADEI